MLRLIYKKIKIQSLVAWSISEGSMDQKQIFYFVRPYREYGYSDNTHFINQFIEIYTPLHESGQPYFLLLMTPIF